MVQSLVSDARTSERAACVAEFTICVRPLEDKSRLLEQSLELARQNIQFLEKDLAREQEVNDIILMKHSTHSFEPVDPNSPDRIPGRTTLRARREELQRLSREAREKLEDPRKEIS